MNKIAEFDPLSDYFLNNPYKEFKRMRETAPVYRHEGTMMPVVSFFRDRDIRPMLQDWKTWSSQRSAEYNEKALGDAAILIGNDPPLHSKYRDIVAPAFLPKRIQRLEALVEQQADRWLDQVLDKRKIDFVEDYAAQVTTSVICLMLGIDDADRPLIRDWTLELVKRDGCAVFWKEEDTETTARLIKCMNEQRDYFTAHIERRLKNPGDDLLSEIIQQMDDRGHMIGLAILLAAAGNETTTNVMTHGLQELIWHPEQMEMLRRDPALMSGAIEEILRFRGTIRKQDRIATINTEIEGVQINKGDSIALWCGSASRDPEAIDRPEEFDITRKPNRHLAFGAGIHMCIGNVLARMETRVTMNKLLSRTKLIEFDGPSDKAYESWGNAVLHCGKRLSIIMEPA